MIAEAFLTSEDAKAKYRLGSFTFNGLDSGDYGIFLTSPPKFALAERDVTTESVPGRNGDLVNDNGRYKNVLVTYKCAIVPKNNSSYRSVLNQAAELLESTAEYKRLEDSFDIDYFRMARIKTEVSVESIMENGGKFELEFDCKPQRYLKGGQGAQDVYSSGTYIGSFCRFPAQPLITVYGTGTGTVTVAGTTVQILSMEGHIVLDCEMMDAYRVAEDGTMVNCNGDIYAPKFPTMGFGENYVQFDGDVEYVSIVPRFWVR